MKEPKRRTHLSCSCWAWLRSAWAHQPHAVDPALRTSVLDRPPSLISSSWLSNPYLEYLPEFDNYLNPVQEVTIQKICKSMIWIQNLRSSQTQAKQMINKAERKAFLLVAPPGGQKIVLRPSWPERDQKFWQRRAVAGPLRDPWRALSGKLWFVYKLAHFSKKKNPKSSILQFFESLDRSTQREHHHLTDDLVHQSNQIKSKKELTYDLEYNLIFMINQILWPPHQSGISQHDAWNGTLSRVSRKDQI